jgi:hypothetical protein
VRTKRFFLAKAQKRVFCVFSMLSRKVEHKGKQRFLLRRLLFGLFNDSYIENRRVPLCNHSLQWSYENVYIFYIHQVFRMKTDAYYATFILYYTLHIYSTYTVPICNFYLQVPSDSFFRWKSLWLIPWSLFSAIFSQFTANKLAGF